MFNLDREPLFSGQPMQLEDLNEEDAERLDIDNLSILSIDQVRESLPNVERQLSTLQAIVDEAHDIAVIGRGSECMSAFGTSERIQPE